MVCESINSKIPYFNAPMYLENKTQIGKIDEVLGPINQLFFTIKPQEGIVATSFKSGDKFYIGGDKLLPLEKYAPIRLPTGIAKVLDFFQNRNLHPVHQSLSERVGLPEGVPLEEDEVVVEEGEVRREGEEALGIEGEEVVDGELQEEVVLAAVEEAEAEVEARIPISQGQEGAGHTARECEIQLDGVLVGLYHINCRYPKVDACKTSKLST